MRRLISFLGWMAAATSFLTAASTLASTCPPFEGRGANGAIVLRGVVVESEDPTAKDRFANLSTEIAVEKIWFGPGEKRVRLISFLNWHAGSAGGSYTGKPGDRVIIWARQVLDGMLWVGPCSVVRVPEPTVTGIDHESVERSLDEAVGRYRDIDRRLATNANDLDAWLLRAQLAEQAKDPFRKAESLARAVTLVPDDVSLLLRAAEAAAATSQPRQALSFLEQAAKLAPGRNDIAQSTEAIRARIEYSRPHFESAKKIESLAWNGVSAQDFRFDTVKLHDVSIKKSQLDGRIYLATVDWANLQDVTFGRLVVGNSVLSSVFASDLKVGDFSRIQQSRLENWVVYRSHLPGIDVFDTRFTGLFHDVDFAGAYFMKVDFSWSHFRRVSFKEAQLDAVKFDGVGLFSVDFSAVRTFNITSATGARYDCATKFPAGFDPVPQAMIPTERICQGVATHNDFSGPQYKDVHLWDQIDLTGAIFRRQRLKSAHFTRSTLRGADFTGVILEHGG
ncbi:MAG TPA: pentapeptide repeat-containing protein, partial [Vineibacter sp.]|nr:pentapeptide repeat-containing protein [Vineibacter sp.]